MSSETTPEMGFDLQYQQHHSSSSAGTPQMDPTATQTIARLQQQMRDFAILINTWTSNKEAEQIHLIETHTTMDQEYTDQMERLSRQRGEFNLRYERAIQQALSFEQEIEQISKELLQVNHQSDQIAADIRHLKQLKAEMQTKLGELRFEQQKKKQSLTITNNQIKKLLQQYSLFLGIEVATLGEQYGSNPYHDENDDDNVPTGILVEYSCLYPKLSFILHTSPICVTDITLQLPGLQILENNLARSQNLHEFLVRVYFLHKQTYPTTTTTNIPRQ